MLFLFLRHKNLQQIVQINLALISEIADIQYDLPLYLIFPRAFACKQHLHLN